LSPVDFVEKYSKTKGHDMIEEVKEDMEKSGSVFGQIGNISLNDNNSVPNISSSTKLRLMQLSKRTLRILHRIKDFDFVDDTEFERLYEDYKYAKSIHTLYPEIAEDVYLDLIKIAKRISGRDKDSDI
jgi:hypothetical protein